MLKGTAMNKQLPDLSGFTGSEQWYRHGINRKVLFTDGVKYLVDQVGAYWLIDEIAIIQPFNKKLASEPFQVWNLKVNEDSSATLSAEDGNDNVVFKKKVPFTDFPKEGVKLYFTDNTILLPSEY
jgi:hypothetical protein